VILSKCISCLARNRNLIVRFGLVGIITFILNYFFVWLFYGVFILDYRVAVTLAYIVTVMTHFVLSRTFTYKINKTPITHHLWRYGLMLTINYLLSISISIVTVVAFGLSPYFGVVFATIAIACLSFVLMKYFVFL